MTGTEQQPSPQSAEALARALEQANQGLPKNEAVLSAGAACQGFSITVVDVFPNGFAAQTIGQEECETYSVKTNCDVMKQLGFQERAAANGDIAAEAKAFIEKRNGAASFVKSVEEACHIETPPACSAKDKESNACITQ